AHEVSCRRPCGAADPMRSRDGGAGGAARVRRPGAAHRDRHDRAPLLRDARRDGSRCRAHVRDRPARRRRRRAARRRGRRRLGPRDPRRRFGPCAQRRRGPGHGGAGHRHRVGGADADHPGLPPRGTHAAGHALHGVRARHGRGRARERARPASAGEPPQPRRRRSPGRARARHHRPSGPGPLGRPGDHGRRGAQDPGGRAHVRRAAAGCRGDRPRQPPRRAAGRPPARPARLSRPAVRADVVPHPPRARGGAQAHGPGEPRLRPALHPARPHVGGPRDPRRRDRRGRGRDGRRAPGLHPGRHAPCARVAGGGGHDRVRARARAGLQGRGSAAGGDRPAGPDLRHPRPQRGRLRRDDPGRGPRARRQLHGSERRAGPVGQHERRDGCLQAQELPPRGSRAARRHRRVPRAHLPGGPDQARPRRGPQPQLRRGVGRAGHLEPGPEPRPPRARAVLRARDGRLPALRARPAADRPDHQPHLHGADPAAARDEHLRACSRRGAPAGARRRDGARDELRLAVLLPALRDDGHHRRLHLRRPRRVLVHARDRQVRVPPRVRDGLGPRVRRAPGAGPRRRPDGPQARRPAGGLHPRGPGRHRSVDALRADGHGARGPGAAPAQGHHVQDERAPQRRWRAAPRADDHRTADVDAGRAGLGHVQVARQPVRPAALGHGDALAADVRGHGGPGVRDAGGPRRARPVRRPRAGLRST
ncbi:MAG: hypothetical protein AVDCRST_MAG79-620, partial [uncultured Thermoleophilia bacterium]